MLGGHFSSFSLADIGLGFRIARTYVDPDAPIDSLPDDPEDEGGDLGGPI